MMSQKIFLYLNDNDFPYFFVLIKKTIFGALELRYVDVTPKKFQYIYTYKYTYL